jgi:hypothetical protein
MLFDYFFLYTRFMLKRFHYKLVTGCLVLVAWYWLLGTWYLVLVFQARYSAPKVIKSQQPGNQHPATISILNKQQYRQDNRNNENSQLEGNKFGNF